MPGPITPEEAQKSAVERFPAQVWEAFNELIVEHLRFGTSTFKQDEVIERMVSKGLTRPVIFQKSLLDVEGAYTEAGWHVTYAKSGYNEAGVTTFTFKVKS